MTGPPQEEESGAQGVTRAEVARGAGLAGLSRAASLIEAVSQPLFVWLFGLATYGLYVVLWGAISLAENVVDLSLTAALQRIVPAAGEEDAHRAVKLALLAAVAPAILIALLIALNAAWIAHFFSAAPADRAALPRAPMPSRKCS